MAVSLLANGSVFNSMNSRAESPSVSTLYYWDETDGKANGIEIKLLSLGLHLTASPFAVSWLAAEGEKAWYSVVVKHLNTRKGKEYYCIPQATGEELCTWEDAWHHWWVLSLYWSMSLFFFSECVCFETENYVSNSDKPGSAAKWICTFTRSCSLSHTILKWLIFHQSSTLNLIAGNFKIK